MTQRPVVAIDLGGTKIIAALAAVDGRIIDRERTPTLADHGPEVVIQRIIDAADRVLERNSFRATDVGGICVGAAGPVDMLNGIVSTPPNLPGWHAVPLRDILRDHFGIDTYLINDAKAAALGEHRFGAAKGLSHMVYVTVSTGIGGGIIADGSLYVGHLGGAGEVGHMTIDIDGPRCACGNTGCWEAFASGTAMGREAARRLEAGEASSLAAQFADRFDEVSPVQIGEAALKGDRLALSVVAWSARYLGIGLANLVNIFNPEMIVVGGGMSKMGTLLLDPAVKIVSERAFPLLTRSVRFVTSPLGDDAAIMGAAAFALQQETS